MEEEAIKSLLKDTEKFEEETVIKDTLLGDIKGTIHDIQKLWYPK